MIFKMSIIRYCKKCICKSQIILPKWHFKLKVVCPSFEKEEEERGGRKQPRNHIELFFGRKLFFCICYNIVFCLTFDFLATRDVGS